MPVVSYCTREDVARELDIKETARASRRIDRAVRGASEQIEGYLHRRFYPEIATRSFDWPNAQRARPWRLWLDDNELISVTTLSSGGTTIAASDFFLRRSDNKDEAPYNHIEIDLSSTASFGGGDTFQRDITVTGLWGYRNDTTTTGTIAEALDASETAVDVDADASAQLGVGSLFQVDSERMIVTARAQLDTGQNLGGNLTASQANVTVAVTDGTGYAVDETILIDSERMLIVDISGNNLTVDRSFDGTTLAAHTSGADIYAPRTLTVTRGALGTTAATHTTGTAISRWDPPGPVRDLAIAEALTTLLQGPAGYARIAGSGEGQREVSGRGLTDLRKQVYTSHGRKARVRGV